MKKCPFCGTQITDDSRFCTECGKEYPQGNVCPHCGVSVNEGDAFCYNCGKSLKEAPIEEPAQYDDEEEEKSGFKKYLPYIIGTVILLGVIGVFASMGLNGSDSSQSVVADSIAVNSNAPKVESDAVIANYDDRMMYQGEYVFDAVLTVSASLEKSNTTITMIIDGDNVSFPMDEFTMKGDIDNEFKIEAYYDYGDGLHFQWVSFTPNSRDGTEWIGELQTNAFHFDVVMKLKEVKRKGDAVKMTKERNSADNANETTESEREYTDNTSSNNSSNTSSSSRTFYSEQIVIGYLANQMFRASNGLTMRVDGSGRLYVDGDYAGVLSVLRYNSTAALLRYGGGQYGEGKLSVQIVGDKFQLTDPIDGTIYYQK